MKALTSQGIPIHVDGSETSDLIEYITSQQSQGSGATGPAGVTGVPGVTGSPGATGLAGVGLTGPAGVTGIPGVTGSAGVQGSQGVTGLQGVTGVAGVTGSPGVTGTTGVTGSPGVTGAAGAGDAFPVGSVFIAVVATNPGTLLGYGTWSAFGAGRVLVGLDAGQTEFDTAEETGGAKTHTLTSTEMPAHTHIITSQTATTGGATSYEHGTLDTSSAEAEATEVTGSTGGGGAHNNLQPYIVVYMWKRTA